MTGRHGKVALIIALAAWPLATAQAQIYKYTDANGIVHFTNKKPPSGQEFATFRFPCYASDPKCGRTVNWENVPLMTSLFRQEIQEAASRYAVDESLIRAIIHAESAYRVDARSPKGAQGLMQLMPATQTELGVDDPYDPAGNITGGTRYLSEMLAQFGGDIDLATAAYNAGPEAVRRHGGIPPYEETTEYVRRIKILYRRYRTAGA